MKHASPVTMIAAPARAALQWRLLLLWALWMLIPSAILVLPMWQVLRDNLDHSVHAAVLARQLDMTVLTDLLAAHGKNAMAFTHASVLALVVTLLLSPLLSGMAVTAARAPGPPGFGALTAGALAEYPRMAAMLLWSALPLGAAVLAGGALMDAGDGGGSALAAAGALVLVALAHASVEAGRAMLALDRRRRWPMRAWWDGCRLLVRRPLASLGGYTVITGAGLGLAAVLALGRAHIAGASLSGFVAAFVVVQVAVAVLGWMRTARLMALIRVARTQQPCTG